MWHQDQSYSPKGFVSYFVLFFVLCLCGSAVSSETFLVLVVPEGTTMEQCNGGELDISTKGNVATERNNVNMGVQAPQHGPHLFINEQGFREFFTVTKKEEVKNINFFRRGKWTFPLNTSQTAEKRNGKADTKLD